MPLYTMIIAPTRAKSLFFLSLQNRCARSIFQLVLLITKVTHEILI